MKIEWNKVTWYSKLAAVVFFIAVLPILAFYLGTQYQEVKSNINNDLIVTTDLNSGWKSFKNEKVGYSFSYPSRYTVESLLVQEKNAEQADDVSVLIPDVIGSGFGLILFRKDINNENPKSKLADFVNGYWRYEKARTELEKQKSSTYTWLISNVSTTTINGLLAEQFTVTESDYKKISKTHIFLQKPNSNEYVWIIVYNMNKDTKRFLSSFKLDI